MGVSLFLVLLPTKLLIEFKQVDSDEKYVSIFQSYLFVKLKYHAMEVFLPSFTQIQF